MITLDKIRSKQRPTNDINKRLKALYESEWSGYENHIRDHEDITNPYLIAASDEYASASLKVVICGKVTDGWGGEFDNEIADGTPPTIDDLCSLYDIYANEECGSGTYSFWQFFRKIKSMTADLSVGYAATNIIKIGRAEKADYTQEIKNLTKEHFNVARRELEILSPDIIIFTTGPKYDHIIQEFLNENISFSAFDGCINEANMRKVDGIQQPHLGAYRTYHPFYLRTQKYFDKTVDFFVDTIAAAENLKKQ